MQNWLAILPAGLLVVAASLKGHALLNSPAAELMIGGSFTLTVIVVCLELLLAAWLVSRFELDKATVASAVVFVVFAVVSLYKGLQGESNCACFGAIETSPWLSLVLDLSAIVCLAAVRPETKKQSIDRFSQIVMGFGIAGCVAFVSTIFWYGPVSLDSSGGGMEYGGVTVIDPVDWPGKPFPLQRWIADGGELQQGHWTVVIYLSHCEMCHTLIDMYMKSDEKRNMAFVEVPSHDDTVRRNGSKVRWLQLDESRDWFVEAPVLLELQDGVVTGLQTRNDLKVAIDVGLLPQ